MSSDEAAIRVTGVSKHYLMFEKPEDRLKQMIVPRLRRLAGRPARKYFRDFTAVSNVSFEVKRGETVGIIGRNGSGKSTLLQMVVGTLTPSSGSIEVHGRIAALLELGAGFNPEFTGRENVYLNAAILGLTRAETEQRFDAIAAFADIGIFIDQPVKTYSSGMYVRLAFAVAINVDPDILIVDEALSVGDEAFQRKCFARIEDIRARGATILFVSHGAQTIVQLCDRAMLMDSGEVILDGRPKMVVGQYQRLTNANADRALELRQSIIAMRRMSQSAEPALAGPGKMDMSGDPPVDLAPLLVEPGDEELAADGFDPDLVSRSMVALDERGARIERVSLLTIAGHEVNILSLGKRYRLTIDVSFFSEATDVAFGMAIKTTTGLIIAGANNVTTRTGRLPHAGARSRLRAYFEFTCVLLPGTYFAGASVFGKTEAPDTLMHRIVDAVAFKVAPEPDLLAAGFVDLAPIFQVDE